jgi:hypothetical protein
MPCYRCGTRQTDPEKGPSAWQRAVRDGQQVLICPGCQREPAWHEEVDRCRRCGSARLTSLLGEIRCRDCGAVEDAPAGRPPPRVSGLSADVAAALARVLPPERGQPYRHPS